MLATFFDRLTRSPFGKKITDAIQEEERIEILRAAAAPKYVDALKRLAAEAPAIGKAIAAKEAEAARMTQEYEKSIGKVCLEIYNLRGKIAVLEVAAQREEGVLSKTAPSAIHDFLCELLSESDLTRAKISTSHDAAFMDDGKAYKKQTRLTTNAEAVKARLDAIAEARKQAEALRFLAMDGQELSNRLAAIRSAIRPMANLEVLITTSTDR